MSQTRMLLTKHLPLRHVPDTNALILRVGQNQFLAWMKEHAGNVIIVTTTRVHLPRFWLWQLHILNVTILCRLEDMPKYFKHRVAPNLTFSNSAEAEFGQISELKFGRSRSQSRIWLKLVFWSQNDTPVIKLMASTMLSAAIEAVHFSASFVALLFASYW